MSRPQTEAEYLARMVPPSAAGTALGRRSFLKGAMGAGAALSVPGLLAACGGGDGGGGGGGGSSTVSLGSNGSDELPRKVNNALAAAFKEQGGPTVKQNVIDHNTFQENINNYLQGKPDDVFTWFAGYRMRFFAEKGLTGDVTPAWKDLTGFTDAFKEASTGNDGKQYFVPLSYYPWAIFYRKSVFEQGGYTVPKTLDELTALSKQMQSDKLNPIAFADKDGWPAMGTFDVLNMRINGFDYHVDLMAGKESWDSPEVKEVFSTWASLLPYHQPDALGRTWQEAAQSLQQKKSGMYLLGLFVAQQFSPEEQADLDFFTFPEVDSTIGAGAIDAPIDGYMMARDPRNKEGALDYLAFLGSKAAGDIMTKTDPSTIAANTEADTSSYTPLQQKAAELVSSAENVAQFLDRDTRPEFASTVVIPALQTFIKSPKDIDGLTKQLESQKKSIFTS